MKRLVVALTLALLAIVAVAQEKQEAPQPKIAATINGEVLTAEQLDQLYAKLSTQMKANYERSGGKIQFLDNYIRKRLMIQEALKSGFDKQPGVVFDLQTARDSALFDRYIRDVVAMNIVNEAAIKAYYDANQQKFHRGEMVKARHIIATPAAGNVVNSTGDDAKSKEEALQKMTSLAQQIAAGVASFADVAAKFSEDGSAPLGGDLGWVERGKMVEAF